MTNRDKYEYGYQLYKDGLSLAQVGDELGVTRQSVYEAFKRRGFDLRSPNKRPCQMYDGKKFTLRNSGYYGMTTGDRVHMQRYVWEKERGPIPDGYDIHHKDGDKSNNDIKNLECLPKSEHTKKYSPHNNQYGEGSRPIKMISSDGNESVFESTSVAAGEMGVTKSAINNCINGKSKTCCGYKWRYV